MSALADALRRAVQEFEAEVGRLGDDPASVALLYADTWEHPYTLLDVARCAVELERARRGGGRKPDDGRVELARQFLSERPAATDAEVLLALRKDKRLTKARARDLRCAIAAARKKYFCPN